MDRIDELGYAGCALVDAGTLAGCPAIQKALSDTRKGKREKKKAILGSQFYICQLDATIKDNNNSLDAIYVLAKNADGWKHLIQASSQSYKPEVMWKKPRLDLERLASYSHDGFIVYGGSIGSDLANLIFTDPALAYKVKSEADIKTLVYPDWTTRLTTRVEQYKTLFGADNVYLEVELIDPLPSAQLLAKAMRYVGKKCNVPCIAVASSYYPKKQDATDQRVLLSCAQETTIRDLQERLDTIEIQTSRFFTSNNYHIPSLEEMQAIHLPEELENTVKLAARCEEYSLGHEPRFPRFTTQNGMSEDELLKKHCGEGWNKFIKGTVPKENIKVYADRIKRELDVFFEAGLSSYFLIVEDIIKWAISQGIRTGIGRGSGAGCLASYLLNITKVDPLVYDLLFERFYSPARNTPSHVSFEESPF